MKTSKIAFFAAAATLAFSGAAWAQNMPATPPMATDGMPPASTMATPPVAQPSADTAAAPTAAAVAADYKVGTEIKDPAGIVIGSVSGSSVAADGSATVVITNGTAKFALPTASLAATPAGVTTTATKAQIDATLAATKPQ